MKFLALQHVDWEGLGLIERYLPNLNATAEIIHLYKKDKIPFQKVKEYEYQAIINLGSPSTAYKPETNPTYLDEAELHKTIRKLKIPSFNICYSMQLFSVVHGGKVSANPNGKEVGFHSVYLTNEGKKDPVFRDVGDFKTLQWHGDIVTELPSNSKHLAYSEKTKNQIAVVDDIHYLIQADPQAASSDMLNVWLQKDGNWACNGANLSVEQTKQEIAENKQYYENIFRKIFLNFANNIASQVR